MVELHYQLKTSSMSTSKLKIDKDKFRSVDELNKVIYTTNPEDFNSDYLKYLRKYG